MCGRIVQGSGPLRLAIVDGIEIRDTLMRLSAFVLIAPTAI
jgi:hypothetical protein